MTVHVHIITSHTSLVVSYYHDHFSVGLKIVLLPLLLLAAMTYNQVRPLRINYLAS